MFKLNLNPQSSVSQAIVVLNPTDASVLSDHQSDYLLSKIEAKDEDFYGMFVSQSRLVFVAIVQKKDFSHTEWLEKLRQAGAKICSMLNAEKVETAFLESSVESEFILAFMEGLYLKNYQFLYYKKEADKLANSLKTVLISNASLTQSQLDRINLVCQITHQVRDLCNHPPYIQNAQSFVEQARNMAQGTSIEFEVFDEAKIIEEKMTGLINVNRGSAEPPAFLKMEYKPQSPQNDKPVVLVGKGILFDTGGYSLKPSDKMQHMKVDMAGGAAMVGTICAAAKLGLNLHIVTLVPLCENRVNENAYTVDEVIQYPNGLSVEVLNTDAEGRLILADALLFAQRLNPWFVMDCATLTGASAMITGEHGITFNSKNLPHQDWLVEAGFQTHERLIELPLWREYGEALKSQVADIKNIGDSTAGATAAAKFLEHFTNYPWAHLDIAGMSWISNASGYQHPGGSGVGVRLLTKFLERITQQ
jgi:leucyl aminopeptidase